MKYFKCPQCKRHECYKYSFESRLWYKCLYCGL